MRVTSRVYEGVTVSRPCAPAVSCWRCRGCECCGVPWLLLPIRSGAPPAWAGAQPRAVSPRAPVGGIGHEGCICTKAEKGAQWAIRARLHAARGWGAVCCLAAAVALFWCPAGAVLPCPAGAVAAAGGNGCTRHATAATMSALYARARARALVLIIQKQVAAACTEGAFIGGAAEKKDLTRQEKARRVRGCLTSSLPTGYATFLLCCALYDIA